MNKTSEFENNIFTYKIHTFNQVTTSDYIEAIDKTVLDLHSKMINLGLEKFGLALSGIDSELIANSIHRLKLPVEYFFLHVESINDDDLSLVNKIALRHDVKLNIVPLSLRDIYWSIPFEIFKLCPVFFPGYLINASIIKFIPEEFFIIVGEGDLEKSSVSKYIHIYNNNIIEHNNDYFYLPIHLSEILFQKCMIHFGKKGESNFYSVNFDTWYHILKDKNLRTNGKFYYDPKSKLIFNYYKHVCFYAEKTDTLNLGSKKHAIINKTIINTLFQYNVSSIPKYQGVLVEIPKDIVYTNL